MLRNPLPRVLELSLVAAESTHESSDRLIRATESYCEDEGAARCREGRLASAPAGISQTGQPQLAKSPAPLGHDAAAHAYLASRFLLRKPVRTCQKERSALHAPLWRGWRPNQ